MKAKNAILIVLALSFCAVAPTAEAKRRDKSAKSKEPATEVVDVFWSMRSPYCYISLDRVLAIREAYDVQVNFRPIWPIAIKNPEFFKGIKYMKYRVPYQDLDTVRSAEFQNMPYVYPTPDPVKQKPNFGAVLPLEQQDNIKLLTYTAIEAAQQGKGWDYLDQVSRMMWNGTVKDWTTGTHLRDAINRAGLDGDKLIAMAKDPKNDKKYQKLINANQKLQDAANHGGVPLFVVRGEPFFGQDRIDQLMWRLQQYGVKLKPGATPVNPNGPNTCAQ